MLDDKKFYLSYVLYMEQSKNCNSDNETEALVQKNGDYFN